MTKALAIGVDIGGTRTKFGLVNTLTGEVLHSIIQPTEKEDENQFIQQIKVACREFKAVALRTNSPITSIGFGVPGFVNEKGIVETTYGFLIFMENYPLRAIIEEQHSLKCFIDNDARTVSLGEALYGRGKNYKRILTLTLGTGVGFGFVVDGKFTEALPLAHMGGHMKITDEGDLCYCGKIGCLEVLVSSAGIISLAKRNNFNEELSVEKILAASLNGNSVAILVMDKLVNYLHTAIHNYVNLFAPDMVVLGGGIAKGLQPYLDKIKGMKYLAPYPEYSFQLQISELQEQAGMLGSAALSRLII